MSHNWLNDRFPKDMSPAGRRVILGALGAGVLINILLQLGVIHL